LDAYSHEARIPVVLVSNPLPGSFVTYVGADDFEIGYREARYLFENLGGKGKIVVIEGTPAAPTNRERVGGAPSPSFPALRCSPPGSATTSNLTRSA
jgi:ABC-type sugar transport system substrate-binding protein